MQPEIRSFLHQSHPRSRHSFPPCRRRWDWRAPSPSPLPWQAIPEITKPLQANPRIPSSGAAKFVETEHSSFIPSSSSLPPGFSEESTACDEKYRIKLTVPTLSISSIPFHTVKPDGFSNGFFFFQLHLLFSQLL